MAWLHQSRERGSSWGTQVGSVGTQVGSVGALAHLVHCCVSILVNVADDLDCHVLLCLPIPTLEDSTERPLAHLAHDLETRA